MTKKLLVFSSHWNSDENKERDIYLDMTALAVPTDVQVVINRLRFKEKAGRNTDDEQKALADTMKKYPHLKQRREYATEKIVIVSTEALAELAPTIESIRAQNRLDYARREQEKQDLK